MKVNSYISYWYASTFCNFVVEGDTSKCSSFGGEDALPTELYAELTAIRLAFFMGYG